MWPGKSPDLNPAENLGAILQEKLEKQLTGIDPNVITHDVLLSTLTPILEEMKRDTNLFRNLLLSFRDRLDLVKKFDGKNIDRY